MTQRKLHIGGQQKKLGWEILNANPGPDVDHLGDARDLTCFDKNTFDVIYASHVLEHFDYSSPDAKTFADGELVSVLSEWFRVLKPSGRLKISVPDLDIVARLFADKETYNKDDRFALMRIIFGGHIDQYDYHYTGLNQEIVLDALSLAGFGQVWKVENFNLFDDTSSYDFKGVPISLNVEAEKPK